jgi:type III restriction enzyme
MRLKEYQSAALETLSVYLKTLRAEFEERAKELAALERIPEPTRSRMVAQLGDPTAAAWVTAKAQGMASSPDPWRPLEDGMGHSIPHVCLKLPTGGGKTLLAAHGVDRILVSYFRQTTGFVVWIVPSEAIYTQTKAQLADRAHPIRQALDRASAGRVKVLEKVDGFTKQDVEQKLCVLLLMLQSTGRQDKETLKVFRDSGQYTSFFPQDEPLARAALLKQVPNLEKADIVEAALGGQGAAWIKQSLGNTLRLIRPVIVLDEGHRAYSKLARDTLADLNPRFMLELSATPDLSLSNIVVNVSGRALRDEEMIKLPIRLEVEAKTDWKRTLQHAVDRLNELDKRARKFRDATGRYIRPILLVRVDRTGRDQRGSGYVHAEDASEFLTQKAGVPPEAVRRQTAEVKELKDDDLLSEFCSVRVIITKDALREGWDCPFAYVLAILSGGTAKRALTQMIGRVLRQPYAARTNVEWLDEAHVFCADIAVADAVKHIKDGLEAEGMGDLASEIVNDRGRARELEQVTVKIRKQFRGKRIMVPRILHHEGKRKYRDLDYEADVLGAIDFSKLSYRNVEKFNFADYDLAKRHTLELDIAAGDKFALGSTEARPQALEPSTLDRPGLIRRMLGVVPNPWQGARILDEVIANLRKRLDADETQIINSRLTLIDDMIGDLQMQLEAAAEDIFRAKVKTGDIVFKLLGAPLDGLNFEFEEMFKIHVASGDDKAPLLHDIGTPLKKSLYETAFKKQVNKFEKDVALYLDDNDAVKWWWRIAARRDWGLQGWMRNKVYPDFLVHLDTEREVARLLVLETKGKHLEGSADTEFKSKFFDLLEAAYTKGLEAGEVELFADRPNTMRFRILIQDDPWQPELERALTFPTEF